MPGARPPQFMKYADINQMAQTRATGGWQRLILTGYRATGKTGIGRALADVFHCDFVDTDTLIRARTGKTVSELIAEQGWECFRELEQQALVELSGRTGLVIATGGGAILHEQAWQSLRKRSIVCWLKAEPATIRERMDRDDHSAANRPSLSGDRKPGDEIAGQLALRLPLYRQGSDFSVSTDQRQPEDIVREIVAELRDRSALTAADQPPGDGS